MAKTEVETLEVGHLTAGDAREVANWVAYQITHEGYVPAIVLDLYKAIVEELGLNEEG